MKQFKFTGQILPLVRIYSFVKQHGESHAKLGYTVVASPCDEYTARLQRKIRFLMKKDAIPGQGLGLYIFELC